MAFQLLLMLAVIFVGHNVCESKRCTKQKDCNVPIECCSKHIFEDESYCVKRPTVGELCLLAGLNEVMVNGSYDITCPCAVGLDCVQPTYYDGFGRLIYTRNPQCQPPEYEQPPLEYYINGNGYNREIVSNGFGNNAYASAGNGYNREVVSNGFGNNAFASAGNGYRSNSFPQASANTAFGPRARAFAFGRR